MADLQYIQREGVIIPDTADIRAAVEDEFRAVFGQDLNLSPETPQGVLVTMEVENRDAVARNNAELANQINPDIAGGIFLDAIWALTGGSRIAASHSFLAGVIFTGVPRTIIPVGSQAESVDGERFETLRPLIIGQDGTTTGDMRAVNTGPVACGAGRLERVASSVLGWETVRNPADAVTGRASESDLAARRRRRQTLALNTVSLAEAITSALYNLDGVDSVSFRENVTNEPMTIDDITLAPHSVYVCVNGGDRDEIASALLKTKTLGAAWNGNEEVEVTEPASGQNYAVRFDRPEAVAVFCRVTVRSGPVDAQNVIPDAIQAWAEGESEVDDGLTVGRDVSPFEIAAVVNLADPRLFVLRVELSTDGQEWSSDIIPVRINQIATLNRGAIRVIVT